LEKGEWGRSLIRDFGEKKCRESDCGRAQEHARPGIEPGDGKKYHAQGKTEDGGVMGIRGGTKRMEGAKCMVS